ncbi:dual specificity protein kinase kns1 [Gaertneriomyces sp. JEL0708]|nr:dual specificity protein kinase kns1 [Gaertneriomyces sp. JEL0708]
MATRTRKRRLSPEFPLDIPTHSIVPPQPPPQHGPSIIVINSQSPPTNTSYDLFSRYNYASTTFPPSTPTSSSYLLGEPWFPTRLANGQYSPPSYRQPSYCTYDPSCPTCRSSLASNPDLQQHHPQPPPQPPSAGVLPPYHTYVPPPPPPSYNTLPYSYLPLPSMYPPPAPAVHNALTNGYFRPSPADSPRSHITEDSLSRHTSTSTRYPAIPPIRPPSLSSATPSTATTTAITRQPLPAVPESESDIIDLTRSPPVQVSSSSSKRRKTNGYSVSASSKNETGQGYQLPKPPIIPPLPAMDPMDWEAYYVPHPPCADKEGHFIVNVNTDLTARYRILKLLGQGTFGKVVEAYDRVTSQRVAIKVIRAIQKYRDASRVEIRVLNTLKANDPENRKRCIHLVDSFDYRNHICMVFELLSQSVFDFLKENSFAPFPPVQIKSFATQILEAVAFLHELGLIHTDLKPENLMLEDNSTRIIPGTRRSTKGRKELLNTRIRLIDFGSAIFEEDYHSSVVSTRHYRAPEIILGVGWSFPCDMWSVGCILVEFCTGDALFQTHDNLEHLALMESVLGRYPAHLLKRAPTSSSISKYFRNTRLDFPNTDTKAQSKRFVKNMKSLKEILRCNSNMSGERGERFADLVERMLKYDPKERITAKEALRHGFFEGWD